MPDDEALADEIGSLIAEVDEPEEAVLRAAEAAFTWRTIDAELAALTFDSADAELAVAARGPAVRRLAFERGEVTLDVEIGPSPAGPLSIVVSSDVEGGVAGCVTTGGAETAAVVGDGTATLEVPGPGPIRLTLTAQGLEVLRTGWFLP